MQESAFPRWPLTHPLNSDFGQGVRSGLNIADGTKGNESGPEQCALNASKPTSCF